jgi:hypothetical protein
MQAAFAGVVARVEGLRGRMSEAGRQVEGLFESLLAEAFDGADGERARITFKER